MSREIVIKAASERPYRSLSETDRRLTDKSLKLFEHYLLTGQATAGLGVKHLGGRTYEFRAGLALRIVYWIEGDQVLLSLLGSHDDVRRCLKHRA